MFFSLIMPSGFCNFRIAIFSILIYSNAKNDNCYSQNLQPIRDEMDTNKVIETIGSITKMENLRALEQGAIDNSLVLTSIDPFPGYKSAPDSDRNVNKPGSVFIALRYRYAPEKINRINKELRESKMVSRYPSFGEIITRNMIIPCIRIKGLENFNMVPAIQHFYKHDDLQLMGFKKFNEVARIKIFKTFQLIELGEGLYRDLNEGEKFYIRIPHSMNWNQFDYITKKIRFILKNRNFDAAMGIIYRFCGPENVIRIYDQDKTFKRALQLKTLFLKESKKDVLISTHQ